MSNSLKIIFAGTSDFSRQHLSALLNFKKKYQIVAVLTQPDKKTGRGRKLTSSAVKTLAEQEDIPIYQPTSLKIKKTQQWIKEQYADIMVVVGYGLIFPEIILNIPPMGCLNVHPSLLPRWRGASPIQRSIWAGDKKTGITIIQMDIGVDSGDILYQISCPIEQQETSATLYQKLAALGPIALLHTLDLIISNQVKRKRQNTKFANYAKKLNKNEALIDWSLSAKQIERCIRAFNPWPISFFIFTEQTFKVWYAEIISHDTRSIPGTILSADKKGIKVATGKDILNILKIQPENKKIMSVSDFLNSRQTLFIPGKIINQPREKIK